MQLALFLKKSEKKREQRSLSILSESVMTHSILMKEAHERARQDLDWDRQQTRESYRHRPYAYYLGLQMRWGFKEQRAAAGCLIPSSSLGKDRWY